VKVGFEVLTAASVKMAVFWVVAPCSMVEVYRRFTLIMEAAYTYEMSVQYYENDGDGFLYSTVTEDEMWAHHYDYENKWQLLKYWHNSQQSQFQVQASIRKMM
jgi:predicted nucleotidyltransferase